MTLRLRHFTHALAAAVAVAACTSSSVPATSETVAPTTETRRNIAPATPNVVYIVMDDMRRDDLRYMPNVRNRIFEQGTTYRDFYAPTSICCPARWAALKGQYPTNSGVETNTQPVGGFEGSKRNEDETLATWLDPTYRTGYIGKYLNGYEQADTYVPPGWDDWQGSICTYNFLNPCTNDNGVIEDDGKRFSSTVYTDRAIDFINSTRTLPYFLHLAYVTPHHGPPHDDGDGGQSSTWVPPSFRETYPGPQYVDQPSFDERFVGDKQGPVQDLPRLTDEVKAALTIQVAQRREGLAATDVEIGRVLDRIDATGEPTFVIFTSDNGVQAGDHRYHLTKLQPYQASSNIPFGVRGPGMEPGSIYTKVAGQHDIAPSILRIADVPSTYPLDGRNVFWPNIEITDRAVLLMASTGPVDPENGGATIRVVTEETGSIYRGLVTHKWKLIRWPAYNGWELYDLTADPDEMLNLIDDPEYDAIETRLKERLTQLWNCAGRDCDL